MSNELKKTPLYTKHKELGARFTPFAGWEMPLQYQGVVAEHLAVRSSVGLFDVSHMGEILVKGVDAERFLQFVTSNDVSRLEVGLAQYSLLLNPQGGVVDDIIIYLLGENEYLLCVNAVNAARDLSWLLEHRRGNVSIEDRSANYAQLALQGPRSRVLLKQIFQVDDDSFSRLSFPPFSFREEIVPGLTANEGSVLVSCTGYTGEDGFEIFCSAQTAVPLWELIMEAGAAHGITAVGLGARDTLRLEVCYPLYGHELREDIPALACGVGWVIKFNKGDFIGSEALQSEKARGFSRMLAGFEVIDKGVVREGARLFSGQKELGWVASGTKTPSVERAIAMGFLPPDFCALGSEIEADVRGRRLKLRVTSRPFYVREQ